VTDVSADLTTDGWRGTPSAQHSEREILARATSLGRAMGDTLAIGYDGRAGSRELGLLAARALTASGTCCLVSSTPVPTPAIGRFVADRNDISGGLIFTASHNPPGDVGLKARGSDGLPLDYAVDVSAVDLDRLLDVVDTVDTTDDALVRYRERVVQPLADSAAAFDGDVIVDAMYGVASVLVSPDQRVRFRRAHLAPFFFGVTPDPVLRERSEPEMAAAAAESTEPHSTVVFMTDGDGDRLCAYTLAAGYISSTELAGALLTAGLPVDLVVSTHVVESSLRHTAERQGVKYETTRVGFRNIVERWKGAGRPAALGVEPNGGLVVTTGSDCYFERDGLASAALVLRTFGSTARLSEAVQSIRADRAFESRQFTTADDVDALGHRIDANWPGATVTAIDGIAQYAWADRRRILVRRSGTEPLTRCYIEGPDEMHDWFATQVSLPYFTTHGR